MSAVGYGRTAASNYAVANPIDIMASKDVEWKIGGITIDWSTVSALGSDYSDTTVENLFVPSGSKMLRYGTFLARITSPEINTVVQSGSPTGGDFTITVVVNGGDAATTAAIAWNAAGADVQTALQALANVGSGNLTVVRSGSSGAYTYTITGAGDLATADLTITANAAGLTGGTPVLTVSTTHAGGNYGMFGPADSTASDGRQTWTQGNVFLVPSTVLYDSPFGNNLPGPQNVHWGVISGGPVWEARLLFGAAAPTTHAPARTDLPTCMPRLVLV